MSINNDLKEIIEMTSKSVKVYDASVPIIESKD